MKKIKRRLALLTVAGILGTTSVIFASTVKTPANVLATLAGKTYGSIAAQEGKLEEFHDEMLKQKREILDERVKDGSITQEEADIIYERMEENHTFRDGIGSTRLGRGMMGYGRGRGMMGLGRGFRCGW